MLHCISGIISKNGSRIHWKQKPDKMSGWDTCLLSGFFHGDLLAGILSSDSKVILAAIDYLKAYAIDCIFTAVFFCYIGFYNGIGMTRFVMIQEIYETLKKILYH